MWHGRGSQIEIRMVGTGKLCWSASYAQASGQAAREVYVH